MDLPVCPGANVKIVNQILDNFACLGGKLINCTFMQELVLQKNTNFLFLVFTVTSVTRFGEFSPFGQF
jgi:hypothetical protein